MEGNSFDHLGNHFPEDPKSPHSDISTYSNNKNVKLSDIAVLIFISGITFFNFALFVFIALKKFT